MDPRAQILINEAMKWVGTLELGTNQGKEVELFQKAVDNMAHGESWCCSFVMYCLQKTGGTDLFKSEHCLTVWNKSPLSLRLTQPTRGAIAIWKMRGTNSGHTGIVVAVHGAMMKTVEGNTGPGAGIVREGDGVYLKTRMSYPVSTGPMELVGFLWPWLPKKNLA